MEAFCHTMFISAEQFAQIVWKHPDRDKLIRNARNYVQQEYPGQGPNANADKQVITGGLYPFQPAGSQNPNNSRGIVDWMGAPKANLAPQVTAGLLPYTELWVWDDDPLAGETHEFVAAFPKPRPIVIAHEPDGRGHAEEGGDVARALPLLFVNEPRRPRFVGPPAPTHRRAARPGTAFPCAHTETPTWAT